MYKVKQVCRLFHPTTSVATRTENAFSDMRGHHGWRVVIYSKYILLGRLERGVLKYCRPSLSRVLRQTHFATGYILLISRVQTNLDAFVCDWTPFKAGCMFQHVELLLLRQLNEPLVESTTMLPWETQEESKQRTAWSRPGVLGASFGKRSHRRLAWSMSWWLLFVSNGLKEGGDREKKGCSRTQEKEISERRRLKTGWDNASYLLDVPVFSNQLWAQAQILYGTLQLQLTKEERCSVIPNHI